MGETVRMTLAGHVFAVTPTEHYGIHTGRQRFRVECETCGSTEHEFWDNGRRMWRKRAAEVFDGGLKAGVPYRLDAHGNFVAVEAKS